MRRLLVAASAALALLGTTGQARAELVTTFGFGGNDSTVRSIDLPITVSGVVSVDFRGTDAAGCAAVGRCGISGSEVFDPGRKADLVVGFLRVHGKRKLIGFLGLGSDEGMTTRSQSSRPGGAGTCADLGPLSDSFDFLSATPVNSLSIRIGESSSLSVLGADPFATRCAGPLGSDLLPLLPSRRLPRAVIRHGGTIDLSTTRPFSVGGFEGTLRSTIVLHVGAARQQRADSGSNFPVHHTRLLTASVIYAVKRVSGTVAVSFAGVDDPARCLDLDVCGATGTFTESPAATSGELELDTLVKVRGNTKRNVRTLLGVGRGGSTAGLVAAGSGVWRSRTGTETGGISWPGGPACTDTSPLHLGILGAEANSDRFELYYGLTAGNFRTRCGGPLQSDLTSADAIASGRLPISALRKRTITVHLTEHPPIVPTSAYTGTIRPDITVTLERRRFVEHVVDVPL